MKSVSSCYKDRTDLAITKRGNTDLWYCMQYLGIYMMGDVLEVTAHNLQTKRWSIIAKSTPRCIKNKKLRLMKC